MSFRVHTRSHTSIDLKDLLNLLRQQSGSVSIPDDAQVSIDVPVDKLVDCQYEFDVTTRLYIHWKEEHGGD
jgi:hypothetical protein